MSLKIIYLGHSGFLFDDGTHRAVVDPFLTGNELAVHEPGEIACRTVLFTHGHEDHIGDGFDIARKNNATVIACHEITLMDEATGIECIGVNPGGKVEQPWGWAAFTQAFHSSSHSGRYMGAACGIVLHMGGKTVYHAGDTGLFSDMKLIGDVYKPDVACLPIGDRYTMGPELATKAAEFVGAKIAIPMHYKTFPVLKQDASGFAPDGIEVKELGPGATLDL